MPAVTVELIKELRDRTGAGLMDCKGALLANDGDLDKAGDYLREKGLAKAAKKASRIAAEGLAVAKSCEKCGRVVVLEVTCETDFVAKGEGFQNLVNGTAEVILKNKPETVEEAKALTESLFTDATVAMGEKFDLRRFVVLDKVDGQSIATYIHMGGKIATAVVLDIDDVEFGKQLAMHIAANNPLYATKDDVPSDQFEHEMSIQIELAKKDEKLANKPAEMLKKILESKVNKHFAEMVLASQPFLMDDSKTVEQVCAEKKAKVLKFVRYAVGEGIEKRHDDFAAEVMSQVK